MCNCKKKSELNFTDLDGAHHISSVKKHKCICKKNVNKKKSNNNSLK